MKKVFLLLAVTILFVPAIASASWWNPFTWNFLSKNKQNQVLETRVKELEKELESKATSIASTTSQTQPQDKKLIAAPKLPAAAKIYKFVIQDVYFIDEITRKASTVRISKGTRISIIKTQQDLVYIHAPCGNIEDCLIGWVESKYLSGSPVGSITSTSATPIESWKDGEAKNFPLADQKGWTSLTLTNTLGERRYYRKEGAQWVRKNTEAESQQPFQTIPQAASQPTQTKIDVLLKALDDQIAERHRQTEATLQQSQILTDEKNKLQAPIQSELDALNAKMDQECSVPLAQMQGGLLQQCNVYRGQAIILIAKISAITEQYRAKMGFAPSTNFTTQQSALGQHYEIYYDGYGGGSIYNTGNPAESYKVYCAYSKCDIYGN